MRFLDSIVVVGAMLTLTGAAATDNRLAGVNGRAPNRAAIIAQANTLAPVAGNPSQRTFIEVQYLETPYVSEGKKVFVIAASDIVDCVKRTTVANVVVPLDDQGNMLARGKGGQQPIVPPRGSFSEMMVDAACSGDWSKLQQVPDLTVPAMRARFFGKP